MSKLSNRELVYNMATALEFNTCGPFDMYDMVARFIDEFKKEGIEDAKIKEAIGCIDRYANLTNKAGKYLNKAFELLKLEY